MLRQGFYNHKNTTFICLLAQNTMNIKSEDVVKNVESNNVESTSNEQRQTNKPIVISRRRLLRAGVAGIPVVLTMAGVAPGIEGINAASAASGLDYDHLGTVDRISQVQGPDANGLIWSDEDGFVLTSQNGEYVKKSNGLLSTAASPTASAYNLTFKNTADGTDTITKDTATFTLSLDAGAIKGDPRLHKLGNYYIRKEDVSFASALSSSMLSGTAGGNALTVTLDSSQPANPFDLSNWGTAPDTHGTDWYCLTEGDATTNKNIKSVTVKVSNLSFTDGEKTYILSSPSDGIELTFTNIPVELPTKLN